MADERGCWGVEIGQAGLKALRVMRPEDSPKAFATAFDYVPHAKILSQPDAVPEELIAHALDTFLSRNDVRGDLVAVSLAGQNALTRFIQLPPVEQSKVHQIVLYEAKQQIPFPLEDVIWDYQRLGGGAEESGYILEAEVGLFAMKRELVEAQLKPFLDRKVEIELVQVAPLALYNFLCYDRLKIRPDEPFEPGDDYTVVCEMGADATTLVVTNGAKIWIRNVPIGGNHFTRSLVKDMKLTFAKAEHLKCNATKSPDPKAVFQAMRPVFNDYVAEIQRSIGYFSSVNRSAKVTKVLGVGNGFKLAGLQKFLQQNLQYPVERVEKFESLAGEKVLSDPLFQENVLGFVVPYGLAVQGLGQTAIRTTLLPPEIATARKIRRKKPWAVLTAASLMGACAVSAFAYGNVMRSVSEDRFKPAEDAVAGINGAAAAKQKEYGDIEAKIAATDEAASKLIGNLGTREYWPELLRAINESLPRDNGPAPEDLTKREGLRITSVTSTRLPDVSAWFGGLSAQAKQYLPAAEVANPPTGPGYVVTLQGEHFHSEKDPKTGQGPYEKYGIGYVQHTLLKNLHDWTLQQRGSPAPVPIGQAGVGYATVVSDVTVPVPDPRSFTDRDVSTKDNLFINRPGGVAGGRGGMGAGSGGMGSGAHGEMGSGTPARGFGGPAPGGSFQSRGFGTTGGSEGMDSGMHGGPGGAMPGGAGAVGPDGRPVEQKYPDIDKTVFTVQLLWMPIEHEKRTPTRPAPGEAAEGAAPEGTPPAATDATATGAAAIPPAG